MANRTTKSLRNSGRTSPTTKTIPQIPQRNKPGMTPEQKEREETLRILVGALGFHGISVNAQAAEVMLLVVNAVVEKGPSFSFNDSIAIQEEMAKKYGNS